MSQTTMNQYQAVAFKGMLADLVDCNIMSYAAEAAVDFAMPVMLGTNKEKEVLEATSAAAAIGFALAAHAVEQSSAGVAQWGITDTVPVIKRGRFWVETTDAVVAGAVANMTVATGKLTDEAVAAGIEAFTQFSARFITGTTAAGLAQVEIK
jgi:hypothetical protein